MIERMNGKYYLLSNFYPCPIEYEGLVYRSNEAAYQASKSTDPEVRESFTRVKNGGEARTAGQTIYLRQNWDQIKYEIMKDINRIKYSEPEMKGFLLGTGDQYIQEGNNHQDFYYGCCLIDGKWVGENNLGKILMEIREELRNA
jgi:ribA/ribD-fused uncharacterized protein